jgi:DNA-directed RNA polymerase subunit L
LTKANSLILEIVNEDHTCGNPICWVLQNFSGVKFAGVNKPDFMQKVINIVVQCEEKIDPVNLIIKSIDKCIEIYSEYKTHFIESYGKYYGKSRTSIKVLGKRCRNGPDRTW